MCNSSPRHGGKEELRIISIGQASGPHYGRQKENHP